jgi:hypothetical protein
MDSLSPTEQSRVRLHLDICPACRDYHAEISHTVQKLGRLETRNDIQTSPGFHQRVMGAIRVEQKAPAWRRFLPGFEGPLWNWRLALPVSAAIAVLLLFASLSMRHRQVLVPTPTVAQVAPSPVPRADLEPTIHNYQAVASRSLDELDELLSQQASRKSLASPVYTASSLE